MEVQDTIIKTIKERSQIVIALLLFFPVVIEALFKIEPNQLSGDMSILSWGSVIGIFIFNYLFIELVGEKFTNWIKKTVNHLLALEIASFAFVLVSLSLLPKGGSYLLITFYKYGYVAGLGCLTFIPLIIIAIFTLDFVYLSIKGK